MGLLNRVFGSKTDPVLVVTFWMKSGSQILTECSSIKIERLDPSIITGYEMTDVTKGQAFHIDIKEIEAITYIQK